MTRKLVPALRRRGGDDGFFILFVALFLVIFLLVAAIVIDLGQAREQDRQAVAGADAGALAGAQAILNGAIPTACSNSSMSDYNCVAAFHTLASADIIPASLTRSSSCSYHSVVSGTETCYRYVSGRAAVEVTSPYVFGSDATKYAAYVNVRVCWNSNNNFATVVGSSSENVCGNATAYNSGQGIAPPGSGITNDCVAEDNFADASDNPQIYTFNPGDWPAVGGTPNFAAKGHAITKNNEDIVAVFDGHGTELNTGSIVWMAPTTSSGPTNPPVNGNVVQLPYISSPSSNNGPESSNAHGIGYVLQTLDTTGKVRAYNPALYPASAGNKTLISYQLPDDSHLKVGGASYVYHSTLHVNDTDDVVVNGQNTHCGNGDWTFTHDGNNISSTCGENSFFAFTAFPAAGSTVSVGTVVQIYFTDESPIQAHDYTDSYWPQPADPTTDFGIDFKYTVNSTTTRVGAFSSGNVLAAGSDPAVGADGGKYWLVTSDGSHSKDTYNTTIKWRIPATSVNGTYSIYAKAYDTDNNKAGNDCGVYQFSYTVTGGQPAGNISLVE